MSILYLLPSIFYPLWIASSCFVCKKFIDKVLILLRLQVE
jgi:hypothetical protein